MKLLEQRILSDGKVKPGGILKVDGFLNHQIDPSLLYEMALELKRLYGGEEINKILTIEASGIGIACLTARHFGVPVVFAKKSVSSNVSHEVYEAPVVSYTHGGKCYNVIVAKEYLHPQTHPENKQRESQYRIPVQVQYSHMNHATFAENRQAYAAHVHTSLRNFFAYRRNTEFHGM